MRQPRGTVNVNVASLACGLLATAALLAGCGDGSVSNDTGTPASGSAPPLAASPPAPPPVGTAPPVVAAPSPSPVAADTPIPSTPAPSPTLTGDGYWSGVALMDSAQTLNRAALLFAQRNATAAELAAVAGGDAAAFRTTVRSLMQGPAFDRFLDESGMTVFLTNRVTARGGTRGLSNTDFPQLANVGNSAGAFDAAVRREPIELMKFIVKSERPWTDMVQANYTVVNPVLAQFLGAQVQGAFVNPNDNNEWRQAQIPERLGGMREHAGVLSTHGWLDSFPTTPTNRNRHRVNMMAKQFLATDVTALAARPIDDGRTFIVPTVENPGCAVCHDVIDPMAAGWQNWAETNRYLPNTVNNVPTALPASYRNTSYPNDANGQEFYRAGDNWFRDGKAPGYGATPMPGGVTGNRTALQFLGQQIAADQRFALGGVYFWYEAVFGRAPLKAPTDPTSPMYAPQRAAFDAQQAELTAIAARFAMNQGNGAFNVRDLLVDLVASRWFRADSMVAKNGMGRDQVGSLRLAQPALLNAKMTALLGQGFNGFNNPYAGAGANFGDFDGNVRTARASAYTIAQTLVMDSIAATMSCTWTQADFGRAQDARLLFPRVTMNDTPATPAGLAAITENARHLHQWLWQENLAADDPEVQRTVRLFTDVWNDRANASARPTNCGLNAGNDANYTGRAWASVIAYMVGDVKFLFK